MAKITFHSKLPHNVLSVEDGAHTDVKHCRRCGELEIEVEKQEIDIETLAERAYGLLVCSVFMGALVVGLALHAALNH